MAIRKQYLKSRPTCKVTFTVSNILGKGFKRANVVGEFNDWSTSAMPMRRLKTGAFSTTVELPVGRAYQFRYLLGHSHWTNDPDADDTLPTTFGDAYNSVIRL